MFLIIFLISLIYSFIFNRVWYLNITMCFLIYVYLFLKYQYAITLYIEHIDLYSYIDYFNNVLDSYFISSYSFEYGYYFLNYIFYKFISKDFSLFYLFFHALCLIILILSLRRLASLGSYQVLVYFVFYLITIQFGLMRQSIAILIFFLSVSYIEESRVKFFCLILIACLFHRTAFLLLILPWLINRNYSLKFVLLLSLMSIFVYFRVFGFDFFSMLEGFVYEFDNPIFYKLRFYLNSNDKIDEVTFSYQSIRYLILLFCTVFFWARLKVNNNLCSRLNVFFNLSLVSFILFFNFSSMSFISYRFELYFTFFPFLFLLYFSKVERLQLFKVSAILIVLLLSCLEVIRRVYVYNMEL